MRRPPSSTNIDCPRAIVAHDVHILARRRRARREMALGGSRRQTRKRRGSGTKTAGVIRTRTLSTRVRTVGLIVSIYYAGAPATVLHGWSDATTRCAAAAGGRRRYRCNAVEGSGVGNAHVDI
jgi:hypothetical protein